jgi:hypothetical protein
MGKGDGSQKEARLKNLEAAIVEYIREHPGKEASTISAHLKSKGFKNHGLCSKKLGFHMSRKMQDRIIAMEHPTGKDGKHVYYLNDYDKLPLSREECALRTLEFLTQQDDYCGSADIAAYWTANSSHKYSGLNVCSIVSQIPEVHIEKRGKYNFYILKEKLE